MITFATNPLCTATMKPRHIIFIMALLLFGCNQSEIPFMRTLNLNPDSLICNSVPQPFSAKQHGLMLTGAQVKQLKGNAVDTFPDRILSVQRFAKDYALAYAHGGSVELFLYDPQGKRLDKVGLGYWGEPQQPQNSTPKIVKLTVCKDSLQETQGQYRRLNATQFAVCCITKADTIRWYYEVKARKFRLQRRESTRPIATPSRDIEAYPWSQTYEVCPLINDYKRLLPSDVVCSLNVPAGKSGYEMMKRNHDIATIWQWIYDHKGHEKLSENIKNMFYWSQHERDKRDRLSCQEVEQDIQKVQNRQARNVLLKMIRKW